MLFYDWTFLLLIPTIILSLVAQSKVNSTFSTYSKIASSKGYTGADVAKQLLELAGIRDVSVEHIRGNLTDHYDPRNKVLRLSDNVYSSSSVAALGVAAHETGHAIQHNEGYAPLSLRSAIYPAVSFSSRLYGPLICIGLLFGLFGGNFYILSAGVILFSVIVAFQVITLPVEFNASKRAISLLDEYAFLTPEEVTPARKVLSAAALTYVAAAAAAIVNLIRLLILVNNRRR